MREELDIIWSKEFRYILPRGGIDCDVGTLCFLVVSVYYKTFSSEAPLLTYHDKKIQIKYKEKVTCQKAE